MNQKRILSQTRADKIAKLRKDQMVLKGRRLAYNVGVQSWYVRELKALVNKLISSVQTEVLNFFKSPTAEEFFNDEGKLAAMDASITSRAKSLNHLLSSVFDNLISGAAVKLAEDMVNRTNKTSQNNLKSSMETLTGTVVLSFNQTSDDVKEIMAATVAENVSLIKTITGTYLDNVQKAVLRSITTGRGLADLIPAIEQNLVGFAGDTRRKAKNVALDQTRKAYNNINRQRMEQIGQKKFEWVHSGGGQRPRKDHIAMNGNIYSFDDLPVIVPKTGERGIPGQAINCMCTMIPVIEFNEVPKNES